MKRIVGNKNNLIILKEAFREILQLACIHKLQAWSYNVTDEEFEIQIATEKVYDIKNVIKPPADSDIHVYWFDCLQSILDQVKGIHAAGIVYADVKLENLLEVTSENTTSFKFCDFGQFGHAPYPQEVVYGTPGYADPNLLTDKVPKQSNDIFSLGIVMYRIAMLTAGKDASTETLCEEIYGSVHNTMEDYWKIVVEDWDAWLDRVEANLKKYASEDYAKCVCRCLSPTGRPTIDEILGIISLRSLMPNSKMDFNGNGPQIGTAEFIDEAIDDLLGRFLKSL